MQTEKSAENHEPTSPDIQKKIIQAATRRVVIQKPLTARVATSIQKTVSNLQKTPVANAAGQKVAAETVVKKVPLFLEKTAAGVTATVNERAGTLRKVVVNDVAKKVVAAAQSNRVVLQKPIQAKRITEGKSNTVLIENLAASTTEAQIRRMCQGIGTLEVMI